MQAQLGEQFPETDRSITPGIVPLKDMLVGDLRGSLWLLFGAVSLLLLIACTNIAALLLSLGLARLLSGMLYGVSPHDPLTLSGVVIVVLVVGGAASLVPAARAALVRPMQVLREE